MPIEMRAEIGKEIARRKDKNGAIQKYVYGTIRISSAKLTKHIGKSVIVTIKEA